MLKIYEYFEDEKYIYLVTELWKGEELSEKIIEEDYFEIKRIFSNFGYYGLKAIVLKNFNFYFLNLKL